MILNSNSRYYAKLKRHLEDTYEDNLFEEDAIYLERNSRDFISRIQRVNHNAEAIAHRLRSHPRVKQVNFPKFSDTKHLYDACRLPDGGYGGLLSATFHSMEDAAAFYGPSRHTEKARVWARTLHSARLLSSLLTTASSNGRHSTAAKRVLFGLAWDWKILRSCKWCSTVRSLRFQLLENLRPTIKLRSRSGIC